MEEIDGLSSAGEANAPAHWLKFNSTLHTLEGTPDNDDVGFWSMHVNASDAFGRYSIHSFTIDVVDTPPAITTVDRTTIEQSEYYDIDYNSTDDGNGTITWHLATNATWLNINATTGLLNGTPVNKDVGTYWVNVSVDDGNGGWDYHNFTLAVLNINDWPTITTTDVHTATQDVLYQVDYNVTDPDFGDIFVWSLVTNATWLHINASSGRMNGTPRNADVGWFNVSVTVTDDNDLYDFHNFTLTVINVNDLPVWKDVPPAVVNINSLQTYTFDVNATDIDKGDMLFYGVIVTPSVNTVTMNMTFGNLSIGPVDAGVYTVNLSVTDKTVKIYYDFTLNVTHKNSPPTSVLYGPLAGATVATAKPILSWSTADVDLDPVTVDVYVSDTAATVNSHAASAKVLSASKLKTYAYTTYLVPGKKYFWTVVPFDGNDTGACLNGTFNFTISATATVNHPPTIAPPAKVPSATTGKTYKLTVKGQDPDAGAVLTYTLGAGAPAGMTISNSGQITWKPTKSQSGTFSFTVVVADGEYSASTPVVLKVNKAPEVTLASMMVPILLILILVVLMIVLLAMGMRKKPSDTEEDEEADEDKDEEEEVDEEEETVDAKKEAGKTKAGEGKGEEE